MRLSLDHHSSFLCLFPRRPTLNTSQVKTSSEVDQFPSDFRLSSSPASLAPWHGHRVHAQADEVRGVRIRGRCLSNCQKSIQLHHDAPPLVSQCLVIALSPFFFLKYIDNVVVPRCLIYLAVIRPHEAQRQGGHD